MNEGVLQQGTSRIFQFLFSLLAYLIQQSPTLIKQSYNSKLTDLLEISFKAIINACYSDGLYSCRRNTMYSGIISVNFRE